MALDSQTVMALQERLNGWAPFDPDDPGAEVTAFIVPTTGVLDEVTILALQMFLGTDPTGVYTETDVRALQAHLDVPISGVMDNTTETTLGKGAGRGHVLSGG